MELPALQVRPANLLNSFAQGYSTVNQLQSQDAELEMQKLQADTERRKQEAQIRYQQGDRSALRDIIALDPANAARVAQAETALRDQETEKLRQGLNLANNLTGLLEKAEPQQRSKIWASYQGIAQQMGLDIAPELTGDYSDDKLGFLRQQIEMTRPLVSQQFQGFQGTGFEQQFANQLAQSYVAQGMNPQEALLRAADQVNQSRLTYGTDAAGNPVQRPAAQSVFGGGQVAPQPLPMRAPVASQVMPANDLTTMPAPATTQGSLAPSQYIDEYDRSLQSDTLFANVSQQPVASSVTIPQKSVFGQAEEVAPITSSVTNPVEKSAEARAFELYPNNPDARQKYIEAEAALRGAGQKTEDEKKAIGKGNVQITLQGLADAYQELDALGAAVRTDKPIVSNVINTIAGSEGPNIFGLQLPGGKDVTAAAGTRAASIRQNIGAGITSLLLDLKPATEAGAKQFDSDKDVQFMKQQATNPTNTLEANKAILDRIATKFGTGQLDWGGQAPVASSVTEGSIPAINSPNDEAFRSLPSGSRFRTPDGQIRIKK